MKILDVIVAVILLFYAVWFWLSSMFGFREPTHGMQLMAFGWACFTAAILKLDQAMKR